GYALISRIARRVTSEQPPVLLTPPTNRMTVSAGRQWSRSIAGTCITVAVVLALWVGLFEAFGLNAFFAKRPWHVCEWLVTSEAAADHWAVILQALGQTVAVTIPGYFAGLSMGVMLAVAFTLSARLSLALTPVAVALRCVPIIGLAPLLVASLGRGAFGTAV